MFCWLDNRWFCFENFKKERGLQRVKVGEMEITVEAVQLPVYWVKDNRKGFTYDHVKEIRDNVAKLKKSYYRNRPK